MAEMPDRIKVNAEIDRLISLYRNGTGAIDSAAVPDLARVLKRHMDATVEEALNYGSEIGQEVGAREAASPEDASASLHAHELTADDAAVLQMLAGSQWAHGASLTLPSGRTVSGAEVSRWVKET